MALHTALITHTKMIAMSLKQSQERNSAQAGIEKEPDRFPIRELSARTNVNTVTIRAWERRYGLLKPERTAKGHRLYNSKDVQHVETILTLVARGVPLGKIKTLIAAGGQHAIDMDSSTLDDGWADQVAELIECSRQFSSTRIEAILSDRLIQYPPSICLEKLVKPTFETLQKDPDHQAASAFTESEILRYVLVRLSARKSFRGKPPLTLAHGDKAPLWRMAICALELADCDYRVQLISRIIEEEAWLSMANATQNTIQVFYQDGLWKDEIGEKVARSLKKQNNLAVCGTAPIVFGLSISNQVFPDLEQYLAFQLSQPQK